VGDQQVLNVDLADTFGNLVSRCLSASTLGEMRLHPPQGPLEATDEAMLEKLRKLGALVGDSMNGIRFANAAQHLMSMLYQANRYFQENEPWKLKGTPRHDTIMCVCLETIRVVGILLQPFMPRAMDTLLTALVVSPAERTIAHANEVYSNGAARAGTPLLAIEPLFQKHRFKAVDANTPSKKPKGKSKKAQKANI